MSKREYCFLIKMSCGFIKFSDIWFTHKPSLEDILNALIKMFRNSNLISYKPEIKDDRIYLGKSEVEILTIRHELN